MESSEKPLLTLPQLTHSSPEKSTPSKKIVIGNQKYSSSNCEYDCHIAVEERGSIAVLVIDSIGNLLLNRGR